MTIRRIFLSETFLLALSTSFIVGVLGMLYQPFLWLYIVSIAILISSTLRSLRLLPPQGILSCVVRHANEIENGSTGSLSIEIRCGFPRSPIWTAHVSFPPIPGIELTNGHRPLEAHAAPAGWQLEMPFRATQLGLITLPSPTVHIASRRSLLNVSEVVAVEAQSLRIMPKQRPVPHLRYQEVIAKRRIFSPGNRLLIRNSTPDLYYSSRRYVSSDPRRHIDARKSARFGVLHTKTFESQQENHLVLCIDLGRTTLGRIDGSAKGDYYLAAALSLARHAIASGDSVSLVAISDRIHGVLGRSKRISDLMNFIDQAQALRSRDVVTQFELLPTAVQRVAQQRSIVAILSDCSIPASQDSLVTALKHLCSKHAVITLSMIDRTYEVGAVVESTNVASMKYDEYVHMLYSLWIHEQFEIFAQRLTAMGAGAVQIPEEDWIGLCTKLYEQVRFV